ncbi:helix-turn-helix domain-containing protein [Mangrovimonas xylaniphaga]|uniref:helix-turn-helix domain-containing protein n=1 Tax=Mangrovimonas xylaniphaga TaxID=1645915 RepID=UPI0006B5112C|nr:helix-turn-helix domain-containing protein [Mangrovimonas xylaniphaga]
MKVPQGLVPLPQQHPFAINHLMVKDEDWLVTEEAMAFLNVSRSTLYRLRSNGILPAFKLGRVVVYPKSLLNKCMLMGAIISMGKGPQP